MTQLTMNPVVLYCSRHTVPESQWQEAQGKDSEWYQSTLSNGSPVFIYLHGNTGTRYDAVNNAVASLLDCEQAEEKFSTGILFGCRLAANLLASLSFVNHFNRAEPHRVGVAKVSDHQH